MSKEVLIVGRGKQVNTSTLMGFNSQIILVDEFNLNGESDVEMFIPKLPYEQWCDEYYGVNLERLMPSDHNVCCTKKYKRNNKDKEYIRRKDNGKTSY